MPEEVKEFQFVGKFTVKATSEQDARDRLNKCFRKTKQKLDESGVVYSFMFLETGDAGTKLGLPG